MRQIGSLALSIYLLVASIPQSMGDVENSERTKNTDPPSEPPFRLLSTEQYKGRSYEAEAKDFARQAQDVRQAQIALAEKNGGTIGRTFHRKSNGTFLARFEVSSEMPTAFRHGIFATPSTWTTLLRFSGGVGEEKSDLKPDVMGLAMKVFKVGDRGEIETMDWTMTNSPTAFGRDQEDFIKFMKANVNPGVLMHRALLFFVQNPTIAFRLISASLGPHSHHLLAKYGSGHPY